MKSPELVGFLLGLSIVFLISVWIAIDAQSRRSCVLRENAKARE